MQNQRLFRLTLKIKIVVSKKTCSDALTRWRRTKMTHDLVDVTELKSDVLEKINLFHKMVACPRCGGRVLSKWRSIGTCHLGHEIEISSYDGGKDSYPPSPLHQGGLYLCKKCDIIWRVNLNNRERTAKNGETVLYHNLSIRAEWNCECASPAIVENGVIVNGTVLLHGDSEGNVVRGQQCVCIPIKGRKRK